MVDIRPFRGYRYNGEKVSISDVISPPYDVISPTMRDDLYAKSDYNVVRIVLGKDEKGDDEAENKYTRAAGFFRSWIKSGQIRQDAEPHLYVYSQEFDVGGKRKERTGLIAAVRLEAFGNSILPHEFTLEGPKVGRRLLLEKTRANFGQIFSIYIDQKKEIDSILETEKRKSPEFDATDSENIRHRLWIMDDGAAINRIMAIMRDKKIFIADGHHRYETSLEYSRDHPGDEDAKYIMMTMVNMMNEGMVIFPTHRLVKGISIDAGQMMRELRRNFISEALEFDEGSEDEAREEMFRRMNKNRDKHAFGLYLGGKRYFVLALKDESAMDEKAKGHSRPWRSLDVSILHELILDDLLGIDTSKAEKQGHVEYVKDMKDAVDECIEKVRSGECKIAFFMNPTRIDEVVKVAEKGERMPQKSTFFYPKVYTGVVMYSFGDAKLNSYKSPE